MNYRNEYERWLLFATDDEIARELRCMDTAMVEDAFFRDLSFGTGGLRGILGAGTNRMNKYVVGKASQGLANYLNTKYSSPSVVIGYDSRIKSDEFAVLSASVFAANNIKVWLWPHVTPVPTVSFAIRQLSATQGVMITASHNPRQYNGYKVYDSDGCQITTLAADSIHTFISDIDLFNDVRMQSFDQALTEGTISFIDDSILDAYISAVKNQSVLFDDAIDNSISIVYSPLNGTGLIPVTRVLKDAGFTNIYIVKEQSLPDGRFPTCPFPNPEVPEAMELGLEYCKRNNAEILIATDPDADRCGIAVRNSSGDYQLLSGNEVGLLLLEYICSQRVKHNKQPYSPVFIKTIVTTDIAERIAEHYGCQTINVLTGFKYIGEQISYLEQQGRVDDFICGFEESYGYLTGSYVRDKDAVNAVYMICEMFAFYKSRGISLLAKLEEIYKDYGYCLNTLYSYDFPGKTGMDKMANIMSSFRYDLTTIAGYHLTTKKDYLLGVDDLPKTDVIKLLFESCYNTNFSVVVRPSGTEPKLKIYISTSATSHTQTIIEENKIRHDLEKWIKQYF